ncbi:uncharacterized protein K452DRAFT_317628 [Aplosporella prunicola CBS 121167]|uniref:Uncharacterized protein n=1 Tax=Aplosporella prunicola CBS 121167 TaxID=1176127 RepID=A0A6A6BH91_9PEZI|nr:uncharacterized protein K452DRAFT_317628 [Aplosporella prunicola CBS 121167]KAF2143500.1 hypothetical protein K452DRAFT_317628 [Aplosporella prunicola CBS 121167]
MASSLLSTDAKKPAFAIYEDPVSDSDMSSLHHEHDHDHDIDIDIDNYMDLAPHRSSIIIASPPSPSRFSGDTGTYSSARSPRQRRRRLSTHTLHSSVSDLPPSDFQFRSGSAAVSRSHSPYAPAPKQSRSSKSGGYRPGLFTFDSFASSSKHGGISGQGSVRSARDELDVPPETTSTQRPTTRNSTPSRGKENYPLVLLHATLLPASPPFPLHVMQRVLPEHVLRNWRVLEARLADPQLMARGLLIAHPRDEYELLEERLLEALDLRAPRILKCGHFRCEDSDDDDEEDGYSYENDNDALDPSACAHQRQHQHPRRAHSRQDSAVSTSPLCTDDSPSNAAHGDDSEGPPCSHCHLPVKHANQGAGSGPHHRWDIRVFAANGLMRAGAWAAAWSEMERVDVEVVPWISEELRSAMEKAVRGEEEQERARNAAREDAQRAQELEDAKEAARAEASAQAQAQAQAAADEAAQQASQALQEAHAAHEEALAQAAHGRATAVEHARLDAAKALAAARQAHGAALSTAHAEASAALHRAAQDYAALHAQAEVQKQDLRHAVDEAERRVYDAECRVCEAEHRADEDRDTLLRMAAEEREELTRLAAEQAAAAEHEKLALIGSAAVAAVAARKHAADELAAERKRHAGEVRAAEARQRRLQRERERERQTRRWLRGVATDAATVLVLLLSVVVVFLASRPGLWARPTHASVDVDVVAPAPALRISISPSELGGFATARASVAPPAFETQEALALVPSTTAVLATASPLSSVQVVFSSSATTATAAPPLATPSSSPSGQQHQQEQQHEDQATSSTDQTSAFAFTFTYPTTPASAAAPNTVMDIDTDTPMEVDVDVDAPAHPAVIPDTHPSPHEPLAPAPAAVLLAAAPMEVLLPVCVAEGEGEGEGTQTCPRTRAASVAASGVKDDARVADHEAAAIVRVGAVLAADVVEESAAAEEVQAAAPAELVVLSERVRERETCPAPAPADLVEAVVGEEKVVQEGQEV